MNQKLEIAKALHECKKKAVESINICFHPKCKKIQSIIFYPTGTRLEHSEQAKQSFCVPFVQSGRHRLLG